MYIFMVKVTLELIKRHKNICHCLSLSLTHSRRIYSISHSLPISLSLSLYLQPTLANGPLYRFVTNSKYTTLVMFELANQVQSPRVESSVFRNFI